MFENRNDIAESGQSGREAADAVKVQAAPAPLAGGVLLSAGEYYGLVSALSTSLVLLAASLGAALIAFR